MREIKFEYGFDNHAPIIYTLSQIEFGLDFSETGAVRYRRQFIGINDKSGVEICDGDIIQFSDKFEWYRSPVMTKSEIDSVLNDHVKYPYERRAVDIPECYEWLLSPEIQQYWEVIGNIHENPELLEQSE